MSHFDCFASNVFLSGKEAKDRISDFPNRFALDCYTVFPGFCDVHVHFREPGFSYKETIASGCAAAAHGGFTAVCTMPNLNPVPDNAEHLGQELARIAQSNGVHVFPYGALTVEQKGEIPADLAGMAEKVVAFSDDGKGVQQESMMRALMQEAQRLGKVVAAHCEDNTLLHGGYIHDGAYAKQHGHRGICSESEWGPIARDLRLAEETGCAYHVCHISCKESVQLIRNAKARGVNVSCETAPHYLLLSEKDLQEDGRFKMNPPLRSEEDRQALLEGIVDGTIDMIATDHAPHSAEEKSKGLTGSAFGIVGLETAFPALYTELVKKQKRIGLERLIELMAIFPRQRFGIPFDGYSVWNLSECETVDPSRFLTKGRATPFEKMEFYGINYFTYCRRRAVYERKV
ncbi:MAG: dihydroorotase [Clostridia bacterium]|nr:dihydroorotase [Clostridia bacterium]